MKYALYTRVSTDEQDNENQIIVLKEYALRNNLVYDTYKEKESTNKLRPIKKKILAQIQKGIYQGIIIYKLDRWGRSYIELLNDLEFIIEHNIEFISVTENINLKTPSGRLHFHILASFAEYEKATIKQRTKDGLNRTKANGTVLGRPLGSKDSKRRSNKKYIERERKKKLINKRQVLKSK